MCGILAAVTPPDAAPDDAAVRRALATLAARGPDGEGVLRTRLGGSAAVLGHRRLALVGLADGAQPLEAGRAAATVNGELYGHRAVRARLEAAGARFATGSDCEILPHLYEAHARRGEAERADGSPGPWIDALRGEWVFVLLDRETGTLWAACDPAGTKPLRYRVSADGRGLVLASEAKALFELGAPRALDADALRFALELQYLPFGRTLFEGVRMLPPGGWLKWRDGALETGTLWDHARAEPLGRLPEMPAAAAAAVAESLRPGAPRAARAAALRALLAESVADRLPTETGFCTHLSGGIDSAAVTALAARAAGPVDAFCASFPWAGAGDETEAAAESARLLGVDFRPVAMAPEALLAAMDEAPYRSEGLSINLHAAAKILLSDAIRARGHKCALTGEGADEAFFGYEHFRFDLPEAERPATADVNPASVGIMRPDGGGGGDLAPLAAVLGGAAPAWVRTKAAAAALVAPALGERLRAVPARPERLAADLPPATRAGLAAVGAPERARALWSLYCMSGYILRGLDDAMNMSRGVESRLAFLDPRLQWFAARIPPREHYGADGIEKGLLREALAGVLPEAVLRRPKRAFLAPSVLGLDAGRAWERERLLGGRLAAGGLFDRRGLEAVLAAPARPVRDAAVFTLASLANLMEAFDLG